MSRDHIAGTRCGLRILSALLVTALGSSCATFKGTRSIDVAPFAQNTVGMVGEVQRAAKDRQPVEVPQETDTLMPAEVSTAPEPERSPFADRPTSRPEREADIDVDSVFAKLKQLKRPQDDEEE